MAPPLPRLVTIPYSHYCEKARWALERGRAAFVEETHAPLFAWRGALRAGGRRTVPVLVTEENLRYLTAKRDRLGHQLDDLFLPNGAAAAATRPAGAR